MKRDVSLIDHLPQFIQEFREIKQIMDVENPEIQAVVDERERIKSNQFIQTSDLQGIQRFENLLNIRPSSDDNLESRISRVMTRWNDIVPYTYKALVQKIAQLSDGFNFTINEDFNHYKMEIITQLELSGQVDDLQFLLEYIIPSNLELTSKNHIYCTSEGDTNVSLGIVTCEIVNLSDNYKDDFSINGDSKIGGVNVATVSLSISDSHNTELEVNGSTELGSNASVAQIISIK